jgi:hypothetical protein
MISNLPFVTQNSPRVTPQGDKFPFGANSVSARGLSGFLNLGVPLFLWVKIELVTVG